MKRKMFLNRISTFYVDSLKGEISGIKSKEKGQIIIKKTFDSLLNYNLT